MRVRNQEKPRHKTKQRRWRKPGTSARYKRKSVGNKGNRSTKQNKAAGEGLELVRDTKGSQSETKGTARKTKQSRWRRPGTSARYKRKSGGNEWNAAQNKTKPLEKAWN